MAATTRSPWARTLGVLAVLSTCTAAALSAVGTAPMGAEQTVFGSVRGRVDLMDLASIERPTTRALGTSELKPGTERRRAVVYLSSQQGNLERPVAPMRATMDQRGETFVPRVLAITVGSSVEFPNSDPTYHNVFSLSRARSFDLGRYPAGRSKAVRFDRPGVVRVFCDIHSHMSASILVFAHPFYDVTNDDGTFRIGSIPPGQYVVNAWMENRPTQTREVTISAQGSETEVDFAFDRRGAR